MHTWQTGGSMVHMEDRVRIIIGGLGFFDGKGLG